MPKGFEINIDDSVIKKLSAADNLITDIATKSEQTQKRVNTAFRDMGDKGVGHLIKKLKEAQSSLEAITKKDIKLNVKVSDTSKPLKKVQQDVTATADNINKLAISFDKIFVDGKAYSNSRLSKLNTEISELEKKLLDLRGLMQVATDFDANGKLSIHDKPMITSITKQADAIMNQISLLEKERDEVINLSRQKIIAAQEEERKQREINDSYAKMLNEKVSAEQKAIDDIAKKKAEAKKANETAKEATQRAVDRRRQDELMYTGMFDTQLKKEEAANKKALAEAEALAKAEKKLEEEKLKEKEKVRQAAAKANQDAIEGTRKAIDARRQMELMYAGMFDTQFKKEASAIASAIKEKEREATATKKAEEEKIKYQEKTQKAAEKANQAAIEGTKRVINARRQAEIMYAEMFDKIAKTEDKSIKERIAKEQAADKIIYEGWLRMKYLESQQEERINREKLARIQQQQSEFTAQRKVKDDAAEANRIAKERTEIARKSYEEQLKFYEKWINESYAKEKEYNAKINNLAKERSEAAKKTYEEQARFYEKMIREQYKKEQVAQAKSKRERFDSYLNRYEGAMMYSDHAKSIDREKEAIKHLEAARNSLKSTDAKYQDKLVMLNDAIRKHKQNIEQATEASRLMGERHQNLMNTVDQLKRSMALLFSVSAMRNYVNKLVEVRGEFELQQKSLAAILQNKHQADILWNKTVQLAVKSPFRVGELVSYTKQLAAYRIEADKLYETNKMLADISAGLGVDMGRLILAFGQVKAANYLRGTELRQFSEAGVNILGELSKYFTELEGRAVSVGEVFERVSKRMVTFEDVNKVLKNLTSESGIFYEMQEKQSETLKGMISNLRDSVDLMLNEIGKSGEGVLKTVVSSVKAIVDNWESMASIIKGIVVLLGVYRLNLLLSSKAAIMFARNMKVVSSSFHGQLTLMNLLNASCVKLGKTLKTVGKSLINTFKNNIWIVAALGLVKVITDLTDRNGKLRDSINEINDIHDAEFVKIKKLTDAYNKLGKAKAKNQDKKEDIKEDKDVEAKKAKIKELADYSKEHGLKINFDLDSLKEQDLDKTFKELNERLNFTINAETNIETIIAEASSAIEGWGSIFGDNFDTDIKEFNNAFSNFGGEARDVVGKTMNEIASKYDTLTEEAKKYYDAIKDGKKETETDDEYLIRQIQYLGQINKIYSKRERIGATQTFYTEYQLRNGKELNKLEFDRLNLKRKQQEAEYELSKIAHNIINKYGGDKAWSELTKEQKVSIRLAIDRVFEKKQLNESAKRASEFFLAKTLKIPFKLTPAKETDVLEDWQQRVFNSINSLNEDLEGKYRIRFTIDNVKGKTKEQVQNYFKGLLDVAKSAVKVYEELQGEQQIIGDSEYKMFKTQLPYLEKMVRVVGLNEEKDKDKKKKEQEQVKILKNRISLINEIGDAYKNLNKIMDKDYAKQQVINSYTETFKKAFEGTGINFKSSYIDNDKLDQLEKDGELAGEVLTEAMMNKVKELQKNGTYIRDFDEALVERIKSKEGFRSKAYNKDGTWTIGYGETKGVKEGDTITQEEADMKLRSRLANDFRKDLNSVLDVNKELILTQEQYNALLDLTYQGGKKAVINLLKYAFNEEKGLEHIMEMYKKLKKAGFDAYAEQIGANFQENFKKSKTIYEKIAMLLKTMNLTVRGGKIQNDLYKGMQKRSNERSAMFSGDLKIAKILQAIVTDVAEVDFTNVKGLIEALQKLVPIALKEGKESVLLLERELAKHKVNLNVETKLIFDKAIDDQMEALFGGYQMYVELEGMDVPQEWAKEMFDVDSIDLSTLREKIEEMSELYQGTDREEKYKEQLKKLAELEKDAQEERVKRYIQYIRKEQDERVKLKVEEIKRLNEVEKNDDFSPDVKYELRDKIKKEYDTKSQKQEWEHFKQSGMYESMFADLELLGTQALNAIYDNLQQLRGALTDLPMEDVKEIMRIISEIENVKAERNPFEAFKESIKEIKALEKEGRTEEFLQAELIASQTKIDLAEKELVAINAIEHARQSGRDVTDDMIEGQEEYNKYLKMSPIMLLSQKTALEAIVKTNKENQKQNQKDTDSYKRAKKAVDALGKGWNQVFDYASKGYDSIKSILAAIGVSADSTAMVLADMGMGLVELTGQAVMFALQMEIVGTAVNSALGPIGWAVIALQGIATVFNALFGIGDKKKEKQIKQEKELIESLERAYQKLEKSIEDAYSVNTILLNNERAEANLRSQIDARRRMIQLEEDKKKTDHDQIRTWEEEIEDLSDKIKELKESELEALGGFGSQASYKSAAEEFANSWYEAFKETGLGMNALEETFGEFMNNVVKKQLLLRGTEQILKPLLNMVDESVKDAIITKEEIDNLNQVFNDKTKEQLDNLYQSIVDGLGIKPGGEGKLSGLQEGIQGVTEATAQIIEAYLNSLRFYVADSNSKIKVLVDSLSNADVDNPIVSQLKIVATNTTAIRTLLDSLTAPHPTQSGRGLKVII